MGNSLRIKTLVSAVGLALVGFAFQAPVNVHAAATVDGVAAQQAAGQEVYIITFVEPGLLHYNGGVQNIAATAPAADAASRKLDVHSTAAVAYSAYLESARSGHIAAIQGTLGRNLAITHSYSITLNGIAADLSAAEAANIANLPGVASVNPAGFEELVTYRGPKFIGAGGIWDGSSTPSGVGTKGQGIVVGDLDGGTNSTHPSFANDVACGFSASHPKLIAVDCSTSSGGLCNGPNPQANPGYGHGVHTSSTAAGNTIDNTATPAPALPDGMSMSGVAPCAQIRHYKVCATNTCGGADILAGVQNAITDQVDVLNFSISGGTSPWNNNDNDRNFLDAVNADVFVAAAAGNNSTADPAVIGKVNHRGPWVMTVAATTQDQIVGPSLSADGPGEPPEATQRVALNPGSTTSSTPTWAGKPMKSSTANIEGCTASGAFPAGYFSGSIAVVRRGTCPFTEKITNATDAGAVMVVIGNNTFGTINMDTTGAPATPAYSITQEAGNALIDFANANSAATAAVAPIGIAATQGDVLADFSYRGPTPGTLADLTKPDVSAPGVNTYAATDPGSGQYEFMSGTSMATPHVTGAGALIRAVHPDWSVIEVKSALMTTTKIDGFREDGTTPWNIDDVGSGRIQVDKAAMAGLTLNETYARFLAANPSGGSINVKELNLPAVRNLGCSPNCTFTRTVTNKLATEATWNTSFQSSSGGIMASVSPATFTLAPGATQELTITAAPPYETTMTAIGFGNLLFTEANGQSPVQHFTVAVKGVGGEPPVVEDLIFADGFDVDNGGGDSCPSQILVDPSFEATVDYDNKFWDSTDSLGGTSFCDDTCDDGGTFVARTGEWFTWFGGWTEANTATLSQSVVMPAGEPRWLNYWMVNQIGGDATASLKLSIDGTEVQTVAPDSSSDWALNSFEIPAQYLDGGSHTVKFDWVADSPAGEIGGAMIDDVTLDCTQATAAAVPQRSPVAPARKHRR